MTSADWVERSVMQVPFARSLSEDDLIVLKAETRINRRLAFGADVFASASRDGEELQKAGSSSG